MLRLGPKCFGGELSYYYEGGAEQDVCLRLNNNETRHDQKAVLWQVFEIK